MSHTLSARRSQSTGKALEGLIANANELYDRMGLAYMGKLHTGARRIAGQLTFCESVWADFVGIIAQPFDHNGSPALVECKARKALFFTDRGNSRVVRFKSLLKPHQFEACQRWESMGGEAYVVMLSKDLSGNLAMVCAPFGMGESSGAELIEKCRVQVRRGVYDYLNLL